MREITDGEAVVVRGDEERGQQAGSERGGHGGLAQRLRGRAEERAWLGLGFGFGFGLG